MGLSRVYIYFAFCCAHIFDRHHILCKYFVVCCVHKYRHLHNFYNYFLLTMWAFTLLSGCITSINTLITRFLMRVIPFLLEIIDCHVRLTINTFLFLNSFNYDIYVISICLNKESVLNFNFIKI